MSKVPWVAGILFIVLLITTTLSISSKPSPPKYIWVHDKVFKVYFSATSPDDLKSGNTDDKILVGLTNCRENTIQVDPNQALWDLQDTLWHEAHHAANNCDSLAGNIQWDPDFDYDQLYEFQTPEELYLIQDNPDLMKYLSWKGNTGW